MDVQPADQTLFNTQLPYIQNTDTVAGGDSTYADFLVDSLNQKIVDSAFIFELKEIILPQTDTNRLVIEKKPSIFFPYKSKPVQISPRERESESFDWLTGLFLLCLLLLVWIRYEGERRVTSLFKSVIAKHNINQLLRDGDIIHERITPGLMFIYLMSISTFLMLIVREYASGIAWTENTFLLFSILASAILVLWFIKIFIINITGKIFKTKMISDEYLVTNIIFNIAMGLVAFPFVFTAHYANNEVSAYIATGIFVIGIALKFVRSIFVAISAQTFPVVYLFLYLCTLEILPFLVIYKIITR